MTWDECQSRSQEFLSQGIWKLQSQPAEHRVENAIKSCGNYLICLDGKPRYIGEATNIQLRLKQHFATKRSTFFKNYLRVAAGASINDFQFKAMQTNIGRKEIEDFGIANVAECLNKSS